MITIGSPSLALNDERSTTTYAMDENHTIMKYIPMDALATVIVLDANKVEGGVLKNVILNAHGLPGELNIGKGLDINTMSPFSKIKGKVETIWFTGCMTGRVIDAKTKNDGDYQALKKAGITSGNGHNFISQFAKLTGCYVFVPTEIQVSSKKKYAVGKLDSYEGLLLTYDPEGKIIWRERFKSVYNLTINPNGSGTATNPNGE